jgi:amino acid permease
MSDQLVEDTENPLQRTDCCHPDAFEFDNHNRGSKTSICDDPAIDKVLNVDGLLHADGTDLVREAGLVGSTLNLTNSIIGGGILALPYAFSNCGWILGSALIVCTGVATAFSLHLLTVCSLKVPPPASFYKVTKASIPQFCCLVDAAVALQTFGIGVAFLIIVGGLMPGVCAFLGAEPFWANRRVWVSVAFLIVAPISCLKTMDALKYTSAFAVFCVAFVSLLIFGYAVDPSAQRCVGGGRSCVGDTELVVFSFDTFRVLGVFINAYSCQMNMFPVVNELKNPTLKRLDAVARSSIGAAFVWYLLVAASGYAIYGDAVEADVLLNFPGQWAAVFSAGNSTKCMCVTAFVCCGV